jgi:hypothetical protein
MKFFEETFKHAHATAQKTFAYALKRPDEKWPLSITMIYSENDTKLINTLCKQDTELFF